MRKTIKRIEAIKLLAKCRLNLCTQAQIEDLLEYPISEADDIEEEVQNELRELYLGVSNGFLSELYKSILGEEVEITGAADDLFACPCCDFKTLLEQYNIEKGTGYNICDYCGWENDGTIDIDSQSSVNQGSIREYRDNIQESPNFYYREKWHK